MEYNRGSAKNKWTIMMYMRDFDLMATYAYALRASNNLTSDNIDSILDKMEADGVYHPRNGGSTFTGTFKSIQIAWYMFGYYNKSRKPEEEKKLVFTPLGNLLLDNLRDREAVSKVFLTMLYGNPFRQPFSQMDERFNIYGFRLIFKLLRDPRLEGKLYDDEVFYYVMFAKTIDEDSYEDLVADILSCRSRSLSEKFKVYKHEDERVMGLACHEWRYASGMMQSAGILNFHQGGAVGTFSYGNINPKTGRKNANRTYYNSCVSLRPEIIPLLDSLLEHYPFHSKPYPVDEVGSKFNSAMVVELYSFYPPELLKELGMDKEEDRAIAEMLQIASDVQYYSREETASGEKFEYALENAFNLFLDVDAERIGGAGNPDVECIYHLPDRQDKKFDIEAKSTTRKLAQINSRRLKAHRMKIGSRYTMIVTPNYSIGVLKDIEGEESVIIKSATLANYLYQYVAKHGRDISYSALDRIVEENIGGDITDAVNKYVYSNFGHGAETFTIKTI